MSLLCYFWVYIQARLKEKHTEKTHCLSVLQIFITFHDSTVIKRKTINTFSIQCSIKKFPFIQDLSLDSFGMTAPVVSFIEIMMNYISVLFFFQVERQDPEAEQRNHISALFYE